MKSRDFVPALLLLAVACDQGANAKEQPPRASASAPTQLASAPTPKRVSPSAPLDRPRTQAELPTTDEKIFLGNLGSRISAARKAWDKSGAPLDAQLLVGPLASRGKLSGDLDEIREAVEIATRALKKDPKNAKLLLARADANASLHRFAQAHADAKQAHALAPSDATQAMLADLAWNLGDYETAISGIREAAKRPTFSSLVRLAQLELDLGNVAAAKAAFARAETQIKDVSPVPVAWLGVQRGLLGLHTGAFVDAEKFYAEAVQRMPSYALAVEHLAEVEALLGKRDQALGRYRQVVEQTKNPELMGALAGLLEELGKKDEAEELRKSAGKRYDELLKKHPEAMYWHAADFFLETGNPKKARQLLEKNAKIRPGGASFAALAGAQLADKDVAAAKKSIEKALATPVERAEIFWTAARVSLADGKAEEARAHEKRARELNPKIEALEGALSDG